MGDEDKDLLGDEETETPIAPLDVPEEVEDGLDGDEVDGEDDEVDDDEEVM